MSLYLTLLDLADYYNITPKEMMKTLDQTLPVFANQQLTVGDQVTLINLHSDEELHAHIIESTFDTTLLASGIFQTIKVLADEKMVVHMNSALCGKTLDGQTWYLFNHKV